MSQESQLNIQEGFEHQGLEGKRYIGRHSHLQSPKSLLRKPQGKVVGEVQLCHILLAAAVRGAGAHWTPEPEGGGFSPITLIQNAMSMQKSLPYGAGHDIS